MSDNDDGNTGGTGGTGGGGAPEVTPGGQGGATGGGQGGNPVPAKIEDLPAEAQALVRKAIADAEAKARTTSKANAAEEARKTLLKEFAEKFGLTADATPDPAALAAQLDAARSQAKAAKLEADAGRAIRSAGGNEDAMLDSTSFVTKLGKLDPGSDGYADALAALIKSEIEATPRFRAQPVQPGATGAGAEFNGNTGGSGTDVADLDVEGMLAHLYGTKK